MRTTVDGVGSSDESTPFTSSRPSHHRRGGGFSLPPRTRSRGEGMMRRIAMFRSLGVRNYRIYALGQLVSNPGTWMQRIAQDWLVLQLSGGSGIALGMTTALQFLPM